MNDSAGTSFRGFRPPPPRQRRPARSRPPQREGVDYETVFVRKRSRNNTRRAVLASAIARRHMGHHASSPMG